LSAAHFNKLEARHYNFIKPRVPFALPEVSTLTTLSVQMSKPTLESEADPETLKVLRDAGVLSPAAFWSGIRAANDARAWALWAGRLCLIIGATLILAALVYFFAYNWEGFTRWQKLALPQAVMLLALVAGQVVGFRRIGGQLLLLAAAVSTGVGFAVYGQVYQTGADAFGVFAIWAVCILPWVIAGRFAPLWVLWLTLLNLTIWFFWNQVGQFHSIHSAYVCMLLAAINGTGLVLREWSLHHFTCLRGHWLRPLFLLATLTPLLFPVLDLVLDTAANDPWVTLLGTALWLLSLGGAYRYFTRSRYDSSALCLVLANAAIVLLCAIWRLFDAVDLFQGGIGFLLMALAVAGVTTLCVRVLRWLKLAYRHQPPAEEGSSA